MRGRKQSKQKDFDPRPHTATKAAERVIASASQPRSTEADERPETINIDSVIESVNESNPVNTEIEQTMKDYYAQTDLEEQGGIPKEPPETDPMPLQHLDEKPRQPPKHNM